MKTHNYSEARENFIKALDYEKTPSIYLNIALCYKELQMPGMAIYYMEMIDTKGLDDDKRKLRYDTLGFLYADGKRYEKSAHAFEASLNIKEDCNIVLRYGKMLIIINNFDKAERILDQLNIKCLNTELIPQYYDALSELALHKGQKEAALENLIKANEFSPDPARYNKIALTYRELKEFEKSIDFFNKAIKLDSGNLSYLSSLGYTYKEHGNRDEAIIALENVITLNPDYLNLSEDLGYINMQQCNNSKAVEYFKKTIDNIPYYPLHSDGEISDFNDRMYSIRQEIKKLNKVFDTTMYLTYRTNKNKYFTSVVGGEGMQFASEGGVELAYTPPEIGLRDERILQVFGRIYFNIKPGTLNWNEDSLQGGIGIRYKPLKTQNLWVSAEELFKIGENSVDDELIRVLYSTGDGYGLKPGKRHWNYTSLYLESGYFIRSATYTAYTEFRQGLTINHKNHVLITPYVGIDYRYQSPLSLGSAYIEGGPGVSVKYLFNETKYEVHKSNLELLINYKYGRFLDNLFQPTKGDFGGLIITSILRF
ncbi:hypothetical protein MBAV_005030 [Candidatus Magnetobacterium bavaricum]|uniref:Bacteriophage N4 adsorption protein A C-terminal domain-containing protein n=1 Tax=Candidatus Magnetobacterium bavaricum TaxID=29290 RepID=A0A0F3GLM1_9BACT|nr:hypothetical protein MBAV_005030 [Candidatus Magnetobacterium bavaricum]